MERYTFRTTIKNGMVTLPMRFSDKLIEITVEEVAEEPKEDKTTSDKADEK